MKPIYLASDSKARRKLLKIFGLKFRVRPARIKERKGLLNLSYAELVKRNALAKAREVAGRVKYGIIIGADTIVVQDKKIFGKPANLSAAKKMLKTLSQKPQWLYTGIAIIDKEEVARLYESGLSCEKISEINPSKKPKKLYNLLPLRLNDRTRI